MNMITLQNDRGYDNHDGFLLFWVPTQSIDESEPVED